MLTVDVVEFSYTHSKPALHKKLPVHELPPHCSFRRPGTGA